MDMENWKDLPGYEGIYQVSDLGRVRRIRLDGVANEPLRPGAVHGGWRHVTLCRDGNHRCHQVSRLVLEAFIGPCPDGMEACHYPDSNPANNRLSNLRWDTHVANLADDVTKLSWDDVKAIRASDESAVALAARYGVSKAHIFDIRAGTARTVSAGSVLARMAIMA
jgi:hypothetical protein